MERQSVGTHQIIPDPPPGFMPDDISSDITGPPSGFVLDQDQSPPPGFVIDTEKPPSGAGGSFEKPSLLKMAGDVALATPELAATLGSGMAAFPVSGLAGIAGLPFGKATEWQEKTAQALTYEPRTELGKESTELAMKPFEVLGESAKWWGDKVYDKTGSPELAALAASGLEIAAYLGLPKLGVKLKKSLKANKFTETKSILEEIIEQDKQIAAKNKTEPVLPDMLKGEVEKYVKKKSGPKHPLIIQTRSQRTYKSTKAVTHANILDEYGLKPIDVINTGFVVNGKPVWSGEGTIKPGPIKKPIVPKKPEGPYSYEGEGYKVTQLKESTSPKADNSQWKIEFDEDMRNALRGAIEDLKGSEPGKRQRTADLDGTEQWTGMSSTYPEWFKNQGWTGKNAVNSIQKAIDKKPLGTNQISIVEKAIDFYTELKDNTVYRQELEVLKNEGIKPDAIRKDQSKAQTNLKEEIQRETHEETAGGWNYTPEEFKALLKEKEIPFDDFYPSQKEIAWYKGTQEVKPVQPKRTLRDTLTDIKTTLDERGSLSFEDLTKDQKAAIDRLTKDAKKAGKAVKDFLVDQGFTAESAAVLQKYIEQPKEPLPKYAQSVNLEKQVLSDSTKRLETELAGEKKTQSWDVTEEKGRAILADVKRTNRVLEKAKAGEGLNTAEIHAVRQVNVNGIERLARMADDAVAGKLSPEDFNNQFTTFRDDIFVVASDASSEIGRALNYHKKEISVNSIARAFSKLEKGLNDRQLKEFQRLNTDNPAEVKRFLERLPDPTLKDYVIEFWYNSILSGIPTHVVNTASNTAWLAYQVAHRVHTAMWDKVLTTFTGKARSRYLNEAVPMMAGYASGFKRGRQSAGQMMRTGELAEFETKWAQEMGNASLGSWDRSPKKWMRTAAPAVTIFTRALRAMDVWANSIAYDGEINSIARRVANKQGLTGEKRLEFERNYKRTLPDKAHEQAMKQAKHSTFMDDPDPFTAWVLRLRKVPVLGPASQFVIPFVNTIGNLTKRGIELTPGLGIAKEVVSRKMGRGMPTPDIVAKQVEGALLTLYILYKVDKGDIIGQSPKSKNERDAMYRQGKYPWSMKMGDTWIQYRRAEPWNTVIASVAIAHDRIKNAKDDATRTAIFGECARGLTDNLIDSSYFQGMQQVFNKHEKFQEAPFRLAASFVPYSSFWRSLNRGYEKFTEGEVKVREKSGWLSAFAQVIPGLSGKIPAELNAWGEEKIIPGSVFQQWLPYKWVKEKDDATEKALARLEIYPGLPGQHVTILDKKVKLDEDIYRKYCIDYGHRAKQRLDSFFSRSMYQKAEKTERFDQHTIERIDKFLTEIRNRSRRRAIVEQRKKNHLIRINGETP